MVFKEQFKVMSNDKTVTFHDVTDKVKEIAAKSGIKNGIVVVYSHHTTCSVITQECAFDMSMTGLETLQQDLVDVFEEVVPTCRREGMYLHPNAEHIRGAVEERDERPEWCLNTDGHIRSVIMGRSVMIPIMDGEIQLGDFGLVYFADWDQTRARTRTVMVQVMGEP